MQAKVTQRARVDEKYKVQDNYFKLVFSRWVLVMGGGMVDSEIFESLARPDTYGP